MAGDWIKIEHALPDKPEVSRIADILGINEDEVVGKLLRLWIWADQHTVDGHAVSVTSVTLDRRSSCPGLADAMRKVGWLEGRDAALEFPRFDRHNGQSAKKRGQARDRKDNERSRESHAVGVTKSGPEREKSREESILSNTARESLGIPPVTLETALANCGQHGATPEIARQWWLDRDGVGWLEKGQLITRWQSNLASYAGKWRNNEAKYKTKNGNDSRPNRPTVTRNVGALDPNRPSLNATAVNAGQAGKPAGLEADGGPGLDFDGQGGW